jgi:hypothetical protein
LRITFSRIYDICDCKDISVARGAQLDWQLPLRRMMDSGALEEWSQMQNMLQGMHISADSDQILWELSKSKQFTTESLYKLLTAGGITSKLARKIWKCKVALKIRIFLWQTIQDRLQTTHQLTNRIWKGKDACAICGSREDVDHLLFQCPMAKFVWGFFLSEALRLVFLSEALGWDGYPSSMDNLLSVWLSGKFGVCYQTDLFCFVGIAWTLWTTRNKISIQKVLPSRPIDIIYLGVSCLQKWRILLKEGMRNKVESLVEVLKMQAMAFRLLECAHLTWVLSDRPAMGDMVCTDGGVGVAVKSGGGSVWVLSSVFSCLNTRYVEVIVNVLNLERIEHFQ